MDVLDFTLGFVSFECTCDSAQEAQAQNFPHTRRKSWIQVPVVGPSMSSISSSENPAALAAARGLAECRRRRHSQRFLVQNPVADRALDACHRVSLTLSADPIGRRLQKRVIVGVEHHGASVRDRSSGRNDLGASVTQL